MSREEEDKALYEAGEMLIKAFPSFYGKITFNLQGNRKTVHSNVMQILELEVEESRQFKERQ